MAFNHVFWVNRRIEHGCWLGGLSDFEDSWEVGDGVPRVDGWPSDVSLEMSQDFRKYTLTPDCVKSSNAAMIISQPVVEFLRAKELANVEYLPVTVLNHKGKAVDTPYFILHPIHPVECLDTDKCAIAWSIGDDTVIDTLGAFHSDDNKCQDLPPMMRIAGLSYHVAVHRDLAGEIDAAGFSGIGWYEPEQLVGISLAQRLPGYAAKEASE